MEYAASAFCRGRLPRRHLFLLALLMLGGTALPAQTWLKVYGGPGTEAASSVQETRDGGFIVAGKTTSYVGGANTQDAWVVRLDSSGNVIWQKTYGERVSSSPNEIATKIVRVQSGFVVGAEYARSRRTWVLGLDEFGWIGWQRTYPIQGGGCGRPTGMDATTDRGLIIDTTGGCFFKVDRTGGLDWTRTMDRGEFADIQQTRDGGYIGAGVCIGGNYWVVKFDGQGQVTWQKAYQRADPPTSTTARSVRQTQDGGYVVAGDFYWSADREDIWVLKLDADGVVEWEKAYGGLSHDRGHEIEQTTDRGYVVAGYTSSFGAPTTNPWVVRLDAGGNVEWEYRYGGERWGHAYSIEQTMDGGYVLAGRGGTLSSPGMDDLLVLRIDRDGRLDDVCGSEIPTSSIVTGTSANVTDTTSISQLQSGGHEDTTVTGQDTPAEGVPICCPFSDPAPEVSAPGCVQPLTFASRVDLRWDEAFASGACSYNLYRGYVSELPLREYGGCLRPDLVSNAAQDLDSPPRGTAWFYLVTGENFAGEGPLGNDSQGIPRTPGQACP